MPLTLAQQTALADIADASVDSETLTGLPAELTASQCIFESAWLTRAPGNNCFGIKKDGHGSGTQYCLTKEYINGQWQTMPLAFEEYASLTDCFDDHARLILTVPVYQPAWEQYQKDKNLDSLIKGVAAYYATDPNYYKAIDDMAHSTYVKNALRLSRGKQHHA
jgi:flagellum-specific peptidoglycan hydrolase FlgJ